MAPRPLGDRRRRLAGAALFGAALFLLLAAPGRAATVNMVCPGGPPSSFPSIGAAVGAIGNAAGCTITVTGTTVEPTISLRGIRGLTIEAPSPGPATITANALDIDAFDIERSYGVVLRRLAINAAGSSMGAGVYAFNSSEITLNNCTVAGWANLGSGVWVDQNSSVLIQSSRLENNTDGLDLTGGSSASISNSTLENNGSVGIFVYDRSAAFVSGVSSVSNNADTGIIVQDLGRLQIAGKTVIDNNRFAGIVAAAQSIVRMSGQAKVRNNGCNDDPACSLSLTGGIYLIRNSTLRTAGTAEISGNIGNGVTAEQGVDAAFNDTKFANNTGDGLKILRISNGSLVSGNTFSGNGGASFSCDSTSLVSGDVSGIAKFDCKQVERVNGPPRPGRFKEPNP